MSHTQYVPTNHASYISDNCKCAQNLVGYGWDDDTFLDVILVQRQFSNKQGYYFTYFCLECGRNISKQISTRLIESHAYFRSEKSSFPGNYFKKENLQKLGLWESAKQGVFKLPSPDLRGNYYADRSETVELETSRHFFIDEAGDLTIFGRKGRSLLGQPGVSKTFIVGAAMISDPAAIENDLQSLRAKLFADERLRGCPSMRPDAHKTAKAFHACKDLPQVRDAVYEILASHDVKIIASIRRKSELMLDLRTSGNRRTRGFENGIYDDLISSLFANVLHKAEINSIMFDSRGQRTRQYAIRKAIEKARDGYKEKYPHVPVTRLEVKASQLSSSAGLQVIDYMLWALQRLIERHDDKAWRQVHAKFSLIKDLDDRRRKHYGEWYTKQRPLTLEAIKIASES